MARQHDDHCDDHLLGDAVDIHLFARREAEAAIDNVFAPHDALPGSVLPVRGEHASAREAYASAAEKAYITTCDGETRKTARTQLVIATTERFAPNDPTVLASWIANHLARLDERYGEGVVLAAAVERRPDAAIIRAILLPSDVGLHAKRQFDPDYRVKISKQRTKQQVTVIGTVTPGEPAQVKPTRRKSIRIRLPIAKQPKPAAIATDILVPHVIAASEKASDASLPVASVVTDGSPANTTSLGSSGAQSGGLGSVPRSDYATCCNDRRNDADQPSSRTEAPNSLRGHALRTINRQEKGPIVSGGGRDRQRRRIKTLGFRRGLPTNRELIEQQAGLIASIRYPNIGAATDVDVDTGRRSKIISRPRRPQQPPERISSSSGIRSGCRLASEKHELASKPLPSRAGLSDLAHTRHAAIGNYQSIEFRRGLTAGLTVGHRVCALRLFRLALSRQNRSQAAALTSSHLLRGWLHRPMRIMQGGTDLRWAERVLRSTPRLPSRDLRGRTSQLSGGRPPFQVPITSSARRRPTRSGFSMFRAILASAVLTFSSGLALAQQGMVPPWSASVMNSGTPGLQGIPAFLWNQSANPKAFDERPTLRIDREVQAGTGKPGYTYKALWVLGTTGYSSAGYEWTITGEQHNRSRGSTGAQNVAVNGTIWRDPTDTGEPTGPSWGLNGNCVDRTGEQPPTYGCIGAELDVGGAVGPDPHRQRVILHGAGGGQPGSHIGYGVMISPTAGTTIDRAFSTSNVNGTFGIGLDLAGGTFSGAAILMGSGQFLALDGTPEGKFGHFLFYRDGALTYMTPGGPTLRLDDDGAAHIGRVIETVPHVPATANAPCVKGEHAWDQNYEYRCVAENRWRRAALSDW